MGNNDNFLSLLSDFVFEDENDVALRIASDFRKRRVEKDLTREAVAEKSGVALANIARFERTGLVSLKNLILMAKALGYLHEIENVFSEPKYSTMDELLQIRRNQGKTKAYSKKK